MSDSSQTICNDCAFHVVVEGVIKCIHPDELGVNCSTVIFCNSWKSALIIDSPCVSFGNDEQN
ncbi:hypothetical protein PN456_05070 [Nodularia spumigena CS-586/05]|nr:MULTISPECIES: hypothetical protein [Nodularia]MDB9368330.1 hypothetical protein [Nodularia spumigena CS-586/05]